MKQHQVIILSLISFFCFLLGFIFFDDASFFFIGIGIISLSITLRLIILKRWNLKK